MRSVTYYRPQRSCGQGYVFTRVCDSVHRGRSPENPPQDQADTPDQAEPPQDQADDPSRETPWDQADPPGRENPPDQADPPQGEPPQTRQTPPGPGRTPPPRTGRPPPPPTRQTPPPGRLLQHTVNEQPVRILLECILGWLCACNQLQNFSLFAKFCQISKIPKPNCVSGYSEQLGFFE